MSETEVKDFVDDDEAGLFLENMPAAENKAASAQDDAVANLLSQNIDAKKQYITFTIDTEEYGTSILAVQEIRGWLKTTPLPNTPEYVRGVTNLRGHIVPVFDMRARFGGGLTEANERHVVIMVQIEGRVIGLLVDAISDIITVDEGQIQPPPTGAMMVDSQYLEGLIAIDQRMVALTNVNKLFDTALLQSMPS